MLVLRQLQGISGHYNIWIKWNEAILIFICLQKQVCMQVVPKWLKGVPNNFCLVKPSKKTYKTMDIIWMGGGGQRYSQTTPIKTIKWFDWSELCQKFVLYFVSRCQNFGTGRGGVQTCSERPNFWRPYHPQGGGHWSFVSKFLYGFQRKFFNSSSPMRKGCDNL